MGTYNLSPEEILESFEKWLQSQEGEVSADCLARAWNRLALDNAWNEHLGPIYYCPPCNKNKKHNPIGLIKTKD